MSILRQLVRSTVPASWRFSLRGAHRQRVLQKALRRYSETMTLDEASLIKLLYGWGNRGWTVQREYTEAFLSRAQQDHGPILECGSGLSTLLLGIAARAHGDTVWALEHNPGWAKRVRTALAANAIDNVELCIADLRDYGEYSWYDPPLQRMPRDFSLVVCDGPPHTTRGGRYGMLPVMRNHLAPGATILLDDTVRAEERQISSRWAETLGTDYEISGSEQPFATIVVPMATGTT